MRRDCAWHRLYRQSCAGRGHLFQSIPQGLPELRKRPPHFPTDYRSGGISPNHRPTYDEGDFLTLASIRRRQPTRLLPAEDESCPEIISGYAWKSLACTFDGDPKAAEENLSIYENHALKFAAEKCAKVRRQLVEIVGGLSRLATRLADHDGQPRPAIIL